MRRIPVYIAIDCGNNMSITLMERVKGSISVLLNHARSDPWCLEMLWMSFVSVGTQIDVVKPLRPLEEIRDINVRLTNNRADTIGFEKEMVRLFFTELVSRYTETDKPDYWPRIFWFSDGSHCDFVKRCSNPYHWRRSGYLSWFSEINCSVEDIVSIVSQSSIWICNPYDDEPLPDKEEIVEM